MNRGQPITARSGSKPGEYVVQLPAAWELRLRRVLREAAVEGLPDPNEPGLTARQREHRHQLRRRRMQAVIGKFLADLLTADIVGREVALTTRSHFGSRRGSLREHVAAILKQAGQG